MCNPETFLESTLILDDSLRCYWSQLQLNIIKLTCDIIIKFYCSLVAPFSKINPDFIQLPVKSSKFRTPIVVYNWKNLFP